MTTAIYAGTFDPITIGHLSVIRQASKLFGHTIVLVASNPNKKNAMFTCEERVSFIEKSTSMLSNVSADFTFGLVIEYAQQKNAQVLLRGLRGASDIESEMSLAQVNKSLSPETPTVFIPADIALSEISSSKLKERLKEGKDVSMYCLPDIITWVKERV